MFYLKEDRKRQDNNNLPILSQLTSIVKQLYLIYFSQETLGNVLLT